MKVLICHERFLFRFGADRVLILLGKGLREMGYEIAFMGNRFDRAMLDSFAGQIIETPVDLGPYLDLNELTADWLRTHWQEYFSPGSGPDIVVVGGWPFITAIPFFKEVCPHVPFVDFGVVPLDGYPEGVRVTLEKLRRLRRQHLREASVILPISDFLRRSQSEIDSGCQVPVRPILLGADHMDMSFWRAAQLPNTRSAGKALAMLEAQKRRGARTILCLGRWEPGCYKNSDASFTVLRDLLGDFPNTILLVLEEDSNITIPSDLKDRVVPIGFPDDSGLVTIMQNVDLGISMSLWEGFNLPLAEMQWLGRPVLAFDLGAHPEVAADPWYLCRNELEMTHKAREILQGRHLSADLWAQALDRFRNRFRWERFTADYDRTFQSLIDSAGHSSAPATHSPGISLIIDVTNSTIDPANSGVIRVTRRLGAALQAHTSPLFVVWDASFGEYVLPTQTELQQLAAFNGPIVTEPDRISPSEARVSLDVFLDASSLQEPWLLIPELKPEESFAGIRRYARARRFKIAAVFYDAIPVLRPDLCNQELRDNHCNYMRGLAECDLAIPISVFSANCLKTVWVDSGIPAHCEVIPNLLPGEFAAAANPAPLVSLEQTIRILCVSTLEPRKNHRSLIEACLLLQERYPELEWSLTLVGNRYAGAFDIADFVQQTAKLNPRIKWLGIVDDATLDKLYRESSFTVYPSVIEGFGLPIVESMSHGRPCICSREGVMAELAADGGCLTADVQDVASLSAAIQRLATDHSLRSRLAGEARGRHLKTWDQYATDTLRALREFATIRIANSAPVMTSDPGDWHDILYANCLCDNWQMHDAERLALTAILARHRPACSIEVGTYCAGSLSLISQYSDMVFSIDIDPTIPERFQQFENVTFLTGDSSQILKYLLQELDAVDRPVDFILVDGDHSGAGIKRDVAVLLSYVPKKPLFVLFHDSFNPDCRRGLLESGLDKSKYCHFVDLDFVPGRVIEHGGPTQGEMWGGLALAYFSDTRHQGSIPLQASASTVFEVVHSWKERGNTH